jgi:hypothetical protein
MTRKEILRRLLISFAISVAATVLFWSLYTPLTGCFPMTKEDRAKMALFNVGICIVTFTASLTAILTNRTTIRDDALKSFLAFMGLPLILFLFSVFVFVFGKTDRSDLIDFFQVGLPATVFCLVLSFHYLHFRKRRNAGRGEESA